MPTRRVATLVALLAALPAAPPAAQAQSTWKPSERIESYTVSGETGPALYESIGARGPKAGMGRVIAHTTFKLTWRRDYQQRGSACVLASAKPKLILIYTLPKVAHPLPDGMRERWARFAAGVEKHEREHGRFIEDMVREIEAFSVGLTVDNDPGCAKIRKVLTARLGQLSDAQRQRGRDFDRVEMNDGGAVHQLILALVNGR